MAQIITGGVDNNYAGAESILAHLQSVYTFTNVDTSTTNIIKAYVTEETYVQFDCTGTNNRIEITLHNSNVNFSPAVLVSSYCMYRITKVASGALCFQIGGASGTSIVLTSGWTAFVIDDAENVMTGANAKCLIGFAGGSQNVPHKIIITDDLTDSTQNMSTNTSVTLASTIQTVAINVCTPFSYWRPKNTFMLYLKPYDILGNITLGGKPYHAVSNYILLDE